MIRHSRSLAWLNLAVCCSAVAFVLTAGCGDGGAKSPPDVSGGTSGSGGSGGSGIGGGPYVEIASPEAVIDPNQGDVIVGGKADVVCQVTKATGPDAADVDESSIVLEVLGANGQVVSEAPGTPTTHEGEYTASFVLTDVPNGPVSFRCTAEDVSSPPKTGSDTNDTFVDHGPTIEVTQPAPDSAYPLGGAVPFEFEVTPAPVATGDQGAEISSVELEVDGVNIDPTPHPTKANAYQLTVDFNDTSLFPQPPSGSIPVQITAQNSRSPTPAERVELYHFALDGTGPVVTVKSHQNQEIIGGKVTLVFDVVDAISSVDPQSVTVKLNLDEYLYGTTGQWSQNGDEYSFTFDSAIVSGSIVQLTVNITAKDIAGNQSAGTSLVLYLDNKPPIIDLDPGNVRARKTTASSEQCSATFDPLGQAANDLADILSYAVFRTLVWDETNVAAGQPVLYLSGADQENVYLYLQPDSNVPLLINNDGDAQCDALATAPGGVALPSLKLEAVKPAGKAFFPNDSSQLTLWPPLTNCVLGTETNPPAKLCSGASDLTMAIEHDAAGEPVVYGIGEMQGLECTGGGWEIASQLANATQKQGWFCLAASARDNVGNASVSAPLRVCFDNPNVAGAPPCALQSEQPPSCTDGCALPPTFPGHSLAAH